MGGIKYMLGVLILAVCVRESLSQIAVQNFTSYAKSCSDCNSTTNADCNQKAGYVLCSCKSGFLGDGLNCTKYVFCDSNQCCPQGYTWNSAKKQCLDNNECSSESTNECLGKSFCNNRNGIYLCGDTKNPSCPDVPCNAGYDCDKTVLANGAVSLSCIDPCEKYKEMDGSNRLSTIDSTRRFPTDRNLYGWYRYKNGLGLKVGCVGPLKCGSLTPLTLSSQPILNGTIQSIGLTNNGLTGCTPGQSILTKACPEGFYVYKFNGLLNFDVYCTELPPIPTTPPTTVTTPTSTSTTTTTTQPTTITTIPTTQPTTITTTPTTEPTTITTTPTTEPTTVTTIPTTETTSTTAPTTEPTTVTTAPTTETTSTTTPTTEPTTVPTDPTTETTSTTTPTTEPSSTTTPITDPTSTTTPTTPPTTSNITLTTPPTTGTTTPTLTTTSISTFTPGAGITTTTSESTTACLNTTLPSPVIPTTHFYKEENITVTTVKSRSVLSVRILSQVINNKEVKSLEINETTIVNIEMKTISQNKIHTKITKSISPTSFLIIVGDSEPKSFSNNTDTSITTSETTLPNTEPFTSDSYCSKPAQTNTITETSAIAGNTCSKVTSASATTTITTTEEVIVLGPDGFSKSCNYF